ncbi:hypothetical protein PPERSA_13012 [Pseudocohnilembus persalinus]|uniref:EamA domain-containing protein n=1 Tax=Pseudocohnilembus persalinus TaxID=266149 RepID=A0A0V0R1Y9_PSEPJ|nr:hypothetical protein PPERSA_13012 [Pseudocohnilembus persalinus]|eukprot:KRX08531.1 hypothetical protein PPERSA_13012 [Pseudocohnilembus persalinus]
MDIIKRIDCALIKNPTNLAKTLTILSSFFYVITGTIIKQIEGFQGYEILFYRSMISLLINHAFITYRKYDSYSKSTYTQNKLILRAFIGSAGHLAYFTAFQLVYNVSDATPLVLTSPIIACILSAILLKEHLQRQTVVLLLISFGGIMLIIQPAFIFGNKGNDLGMVKEDFENTYKNPTLGQIFAFTFSVCQALAIVVVRKLRNAVHNTVVVQYSFFIPLFLGGVMMIVNGKFNERIFLLENFIAMIFVALSNYSAQICYSKAIFLCQASQITPLTYSQVIFSYFIDLLYFGNGISYLSILGSIIVVICSIILSRK